MSTSLGTDTATLLTEAGTIVGTPNYMAPEQVRGEALDARADLFAVAAMLFEMLAGRIAFGGATMMTCCMLCCTNSRRRSRAAPRWPRSTG